MTASAAAGAGVAAGACAPFFIGGGKRPPNVLLVVADAMRADHLAMRLRGASLTPNIERLAEAGHVFTNCRSPGSWTKLSMASIFTGSYPAYHGVRTKLETIPPNCDTVAEMLKAAGYTTFGVQTNPWLQAEKVAGKVIMPATCGFAKGFRVYKYLKFSKGEDVPGGFAYQTAKQVTDEVLRICRVCDEPFFVYAHYMDTHLPWMGPGPNRHTGRFTSGKTAGSAEEAFELNRNAVTKATASDGAPPPARELQARVKGVYKEACAHLDDELGRLLAGIDSMGKFADSIVIFTADHGEAFWEHNILGHAKDLYDEEIRVPLIVKAPHLERGSSDDSVTNISIYHTLCEIAGREPQTSSMGSSLLGRRAVGFGETQAVYAEAHSFVPDSPNAWVEKKLMTPEGRSLLLRHDRDGRLLHSLAFDLAKDPGELHPLDRQATEVLEGRLAKLSAGHQELAQSHRMRPKPTTISWQRKFPEADEAELTQDEKRQLEQIKALGYLN